MELPDGLGIDDVTNEAFAVLGANGIIRIADRYQCSECTQEYKATADLIPNSNSAATIEDNGENMPQPSQQNQSPDGDNNSDNMEVDKAFVKLAVVVGLVTGPSQTEIGLVLLCCYPSEAKCCFQAKADLAG